MGPSSHRAERCQFWSSLQVQGGVVVFKRGQLVKQSKHLKQWRSRTVLLIQRHLITLHTDQTPPTAVIPLARMQSLCREDSPGEFQLRVTTQRGEEYRFRSDSEEQRDAWFSEIRAEKVRMLKESKANSSLREELSPHRITFLEEEEGNET